MKTSTDKLAREMERVDAMFIAELILDKLDVSVPRRAHSKIRTKLTTRELAAIRAIEKIEPTWRYISRSKKHTYGRKEAGEPIGLWSLPRKSAEVLRNLVILTGTKNVLEIGTSAGYSTIFLASAAKLNKGGVHTIELLPAKVKLAQKFFRKSGLNNIYLIEREASRVLGHWSKGKIDFVFLDADKENYGKYLRQLIPLMKVGGLIVADNINDYGHLMEAYLQKVTGTHLAKSRVDRRLKSYYLAALDNGLMVTKKVRD